MSLLGIALIAIAATSLFFVGPHEIRGHGENPYVGILVFLIFPIVFFIALVLISIGIYLSRREIRRGLAEAALDRKAALRRLAWFIVSTSAACLVVGTQLTYRAVGYMETPNFCGASCHTMKPEFTAYANSPHSRVECVDCHVAPGAAGWVSSKMNGMRQLFQTVLHTEPKPIPSALESNRLVPARETCENCHWPDKFDGARLRVFSKFAEDEGNTRSETVLLMMVGGNRIPGIHNAHFGPGVRIRYTAADAMRQSIPRVEYRNDNTGAAGVYTSDPPKNSDGVMQTFEMQCVDCHNRPTHTFELPERAMDKALAFGEIPAGLPFIKKKSVELLKAGYQTSDEACDKIPKGLAGFYRQSYPDVYASRQHDIELAGQTVLAIYNRNVFPELKVTWGTYPNNLGHTDFPGCFRCHDGSHATPEGKTISQDCNTCHEPLATEESSPEILKTLGIADRLAKIQKH
jgi:nitrate/TMAO reductase-like tetraheme cytochrome c subunit